MIRKIKALVFTVTATLALTAVMASTASAQFTSSKDHTTLSGTQIGSHSISAGSGFGAISCVNVFVSGTVGGKSLAEWVLKPVYHNCKDSLGRTVDIDYNDLTYTFTADTNTGGTSNLHVSGGITFTVTNGSGSVVCTTTIAGPQTNNGISYKNLAGTSGIEVGHLSSNIKATIEGGFFNCGTSTTNGTAGTLVGDTVIKGVAPDGSAAAISVDVP